MTEQEKKLIADYSLSVISKERFLKSYPFELSRLYLFGT
jgi:hypothetical protein